MQTDAPGIPPATQPSASPWSEYAFMSGDPAVDAIIIGGAIIIALPLLAILLRIRAATRSRRLRKELRRHYTFAEEQKKGVAKLAGQIDATSSTGTIAGYEVVRQIEAVFTDGHPSPSQAVEALKALAATRGANAVINLASERPPSGKCVARGDAVVVKPLADASVGADGSEDESPEGEEPRV